MSEEKQDGWEKAEASGFIKLEIGVTFLGLLLGHEVLKTAKGDAQNYKLLTPEGVRTVLAPKGLHDALSGVLIRHGAGNAIVKVTPKEKKKLANGNDFWVFDVDYRKKTAKDLKEFGIDEGQADPDNF